MKNLSLVAFFLINFHIVKEFGIYFCLPPFLIYTYFFFKKFNFTKAKFFFKDRYHFLIFISSLTFVYLSVSVLFDSSLIFHHKLLTLGRINFTYPILFLFMMSLKNKNDYNIAVNIYLFFNFMAAIFLIFSVFIDNNIFLQNDYFSFKVRDNLIRYSTLYGSVGQTGYAISLPIFIISMLTLNKWIKFSLLNIFFCAAALTLSRAAYFNIILCLFLFILLNFTKNTKKAVFLTFSSLFFITPILLALIGMFDYYDYFIYKISGISFTNNEYILSSNSSDLINIFDRIYYSIFKDFSSLVNQNYSIFNFIFGYGYKWMGISLGLFNLNLTNVIYIHNGFYEVLLSSGIMFFVGVILLFYFTLTNLLEYMKSNPENMMIRIFFGSTILIAINIFLGASIVHPNLIGFFWVIVSYVANVKRIVTFTK